MKRRIQFVLAVATATSCVALGLFAAYSASQPVVSCGSISKEPFSTAPAILVTAQDYLEQGNYDYEQGDCDKAIDDYTRAIDLNPNFAEAYNNRAYVFMVKKNYAAALPDLDRALQLRPDYVNALMNRGDIYNYYYAINYEQAVADYDQVLRIDPSAPNHTSVCGHRLLALHHGWNPYVFGDLVAKGTRAGCP